MQKYVCLPICAVYAWLHICSPQSFIIIVCGINSRMYSFQVACGRGDRCCRCTWKQMRNLCPPMGTGSSGATRLTDRLATFQVHAHTLASALLPSSHLLLRFSLLCTLPFRPSQRPVQSPSVRICHLSPLPSSYSHLVGHVEARRHQRCLLEVQTQLASPSGYNLGACFR